MPAQARFNLQFFDRKAVIEAVGRAAAKVIGEYGRRVRKRAQASLQYAEGPSAPGSPPHAHRSRQIARRSRKTGQVKLSKRTGKALKRSVSFLREFLFYQYDPSTKSVVVGPERLATTIDPAALPALEYGGSARIRSGSPNEPVIRTANIPARPFMRPADAAERPGLMNLWKDSVRP